MTCRSRQTTTLLQLSHGATLRDHGVSTIFQSHPAQSRVFLFFNIYALHLCTGYQIQQYITMTRLDRLFYPKENGKFSSISSWHWIDIGLTQGSSSLLHSSRRRAGLSSRCNQKLPHGSLGHVCIIKSGLCSWRKSWQAISNSGQNPSSLPRAGTSSTQNRFLLPTKNTLRTSRDY